MCVCVCVCVWVFVGIFLRNRDHGSVSDASCNKRCELPSDGTRDINDLATCPRMGLSLLLRASHHLLPTSLRRSAAVAGYFYLLYFASTLHISKQVTRLPGGPPKWGCSLSWSSHRLPADPGLAPPAGSSQVMVLGGEIRGLSLQKCQKVPF